MFELHITCTKDIDKIHIDFSDGTSCITESKNDTGLKSENETVKKDERKSSNFRDEICHYDDDKSSHKIVQKPEVPDAPKTPKVEEYLHGLDF